MISAFCVTICRQFFAAQFCWNLIEQAFVKLFDLSTPVSLPSGPSPLRLAVIFFCRKSGLKCFSCEWIPVKNIILVYDSGLCVAQPLLLPLLKSFPVARQVCWSPLPGGTRCFGGINKSFKVGLRPAGLGS